MVRALLRNGAIVPVDPLPPEWEEGQELAVDKADAPCLDIDAWAKHMDQLCADSLVDQERTMRRAIEDHRLQAKAQMRQDMGLSA